MWNGRLPGSSWFGWSGIEREAGAAVLQHDPGVAGDDARAEGVEQAVDERDGVAILVDDGEVGRVAAHAGCRRTPAGRSPCFGSISARPLRRRSPSTAAPSPAPSRTPDRRCSDCDRRTRSSSLRSACGSRGPDRVRIAFRSMPSRMFARISARQSLAVRRQLVERVAAIGRRNRLDPFRLLRGEVLHRQKAAVLLAVVDDGPGDFAAVERVASARASVRSVRARFFCDEDRARPRRAAVRPGRWPRRPDPASAWGSPGAQSAAIFSITGKPFSAYSIAGASSSASFIVPYLSSSVTQPSNAPGTVIGSMPVSGICVIFALCEVIESQRARRAAAGVERLRASWSSPSRSS